MSPLYGIGWRCIALSGIRASGSTFQCRELNRQARRQLQTASAGPSSSSGNTNRRENPYPYPSSHHPTPYQLFHLPSNATKAEIKARYYELVRLYHPDKQMNSVVDEDIARARFQAITAAYDILTGKTAGSGILGESRSHDRPSHATATAFRAAQRRRQELYDAGSVDDTTKDRLIIAGVVLTVLFVLLHTAMKRREVLSDMASRQRQFSTPRQRQLEEEDRLSQDYKPPSNKP